MRVNKNKKEGKNRGKNENYSKEIRTLIKKNIIEKYKTGWKKEEIKAATGKEDTCKDSRRAAKETNKLCFSAAQTIEAILRSETCFRASWVSRFDLCSPICFLRSLSLCACARVCFVFFFFVISMWILNNAKVGGGWEQKTEE